MSKTYGPLRVLDELSLEVAPGELVTVVGPPRSGKTTLIELIGAAQRPSEGTIVVAGRRLDLLDDRGLLEFRTANIALAPQEPTLAPTLTVHETILQGARTSRAHRPEQWTRSLLDACELRAEADVLAASLEAESQQRLSLARALAKDAPLLLLDEPFEAAPSARRERLLAAARRFIRRDAAVVLTARDTQATKRADHVVRLPPP